MKMEVVYTFFRFVEYDSEIQVNANFHLRKPAKCPTHCLGIKMSLKENNFPSILICKGHKDANYNSKMGEFFNY